MREPKALSLVAAVALAAPWLPAQNVQRIVRILESDAPSESAPPPADEGEPAPGLDQPLFFLRDRSKVAGVPKIDALRIATRYGVLSVPFDELVRARFVQRVSPGVKARVNEQIALLGSDDFEARERATAALQRIGPDALPLLRQALDSPLDEVKSRAQMLAEELAEDEKKKESAAGTAIASSLPRLQGTEDEVTTTRMTIKGSVELEKVVIESRYGELVVDVADLEAIAFQRAGPTSARLEVLPKHQPPGSWLDTKLDVEKGQRLSIEASGSINVSNYGVSSGPAGTTQWSGNSFNNLPMLSLVGKVGKKGKPFLVGTDYREKLSTGGRLYLSIVPFSYNPTGAVGKYEASVRLASGS